MLTQRDVRFTKPCLQAVVLVAALLFAAPAPAALPSLPGPTEGAGLQKLPALPDLPTLPDPGDAAEPTPGAAAGGREWTIIAYVDGDNNLERYLLADVKEMERACPESGLDVILLIDRSKGYTKAFGDWTGTRAYRLRKSSADDALGSELLNDYGELNMGDPKLLGDFIRETLRNYPSRKVALFMSDHGAGWINMANDDDAPGAAKKTDEITLQEFRAVLERTAPLCPGKAFDLVFFDMCLMGQAETVAACAPFARYMVASAPTVPGVGMDFTKALPLFVSGKDTRDIAAGMVRAGVSGFLENGDRDGSYTAFDLSKTDAFLGAFRAFSDTLTTMIPGEWANITRTIFYSQNYGGREDFLRKKDSISSIDFRDWISRLSKTLANPPAARIASLEKALDALIITTEKGPMLPFCKGLSLYAPLREDNLRAGYDDLDFSRKTGWNAALSALYERQKVDGMTPPKVVAIEVGSPVLKAGVGKPTGGKDFDIAPAREVVPLSGGDIRGSYVKLTFDGKAILWGYAAFAWADAENGEYTVVHDTLLLDEDIDPEASAKKKEEAADVTTALTPVFTDGRNELLYQIGGLVHKLANGDRSVPVTIKYRNVADLSRFTIAATYADAETKGEVPIEITVDATDYRIAGIISIVPTENGVSVSNVEPKPDGIVRPSLLKFGPDGRIVAVPGEPIEWGDGLDVILDLIPGGKILRILGKAESIGGRGAALLGGPVVVAANPLLTPYIDATHRFGTEKLPGRYAAFGAIPLRSNPKEYTMAPTGVVMDLRDDANNGRTFRGVIESMGEKPVELSFLWEPRGLPMLTSCVPSDDGKRLVPIDRKFAVLVTENGRHSWTTVSASDGSFLRLVPIGEADFPREFLSGTWNGNDGSTLTLAKGSAVYIPDKGARIRGAFTVRDNLLTIAPASGTAVSLYFGVNREDNSLTATFTDTDTAVIYTRGKPAPKPTAQPKPQPQPQGITLDGTWGTMFNGQQLVMQVAGNRYQVWIDGAPYESGVFSVQGDVMHVRTANGMVFSQYFRIDPTGTVFTVTNAQTGMTVVYQRLR
jgi:hypothetical protein